MLVAFAMIAMMASTVRVVPGSVTKVCQVTGEIDRQTGKPTSSQTESRFGLWGTDLGASFEHDGRLVFLFGDSHPAGPHTPDRLMDSDPVAFSDTTDPEKGLRLDFVKAADGKYSTVAVPNITLGTFEVPNGGFSANGWMYGFYTTDAQDSPLGKIMGRSVLLKSRDGRSWQFVYTLSTDRFVNVAPAIVDAAKTPGLPESSGKGLLMWAGGRDYRRSDPYLAFVPLDKVEDRNAVRYWAGGTEWSRFESDSRPLFHHPMIGEISVGWCEPLQRWLMLYNIEQPSCVLLRYAESPAGPWSASQVLFDPRDAFGKFIHLGGTGAPKDPMSDPGREAFSGDAYGPYLISKFTRKEGEGAKIYFLMSTWNPYNVVLMRATLGVE